MRSYYTGLILQRNELLPRPLHGRGWSVSTEPWLDSDARRSSAFNPNEIVIQAKNAERAQAALTLILDSWTVLNGVLPPADELVVIPRNCEERKQWELDSPFNLRETWSTSGFPLSCLIAQRASMKRKFVYAVALCHQSFALHANEWMDLAPGLFPYQQRSLNPRDHIRFAYAIVTAYAALEQIGLSLHGECFRNGGWIKEKRVELEQKITQSGINLNDTILQFYLQT